MTLPRLCPVAFPYMWYVPLSWRSYVCVPHNCQHLQESKRWKCHLQCQRTVPLLLLINWLCKLIWALTTCPCKHFSYKISLTCSKPRHSTMTTSCAQVQCSDFERLWLCMFLCHSLAKPCTSWESVTTSFQLSQLLNIFHDDYDSFKQEIPWELHLTNFPKVSMVLKMTVTLTGEITYLITIWYV